MEIKKVITNQLEENCYIVSSCGEGIIIDPGGAAEEILKAAEGLEIKYILLTHGHFDHIMAAGELLKKMNAKLLVPKGDSEMLADCNKSCGAMYGFYHDEIPYDRKLSEGDEITFGSVVLKAIETPGHSSGSMCYIGRGIMFSGDTLFRGTIGRFDYENKEKMVSSLKKLLALPETTVVYPGHGPATTISFEINNNPYVNME